jgi:hypothetical protein
VGSETCWKTIGGGQSGKTLFKIVRMDARYPIPGLCGRQLLPVPAPVLHEMIEDIICGVTDETGIT